MVVIVDCVALDGAPMFGVIPGMAQGYALSFVPENATGWLYFAKLDGSKAVHCRVECGQAASIWLECDDAVSQMVQDSFDDEGQCSIPLLQEAVEKQRDIWASRQ